MAYEWVPTIAIAVVLLVVGFRIQGNGIYGLVRLGLTIIGIILLIWAIYAGWADLTSSL